MAAHDSNERLTQAVDEAVAALASGRPPADTLAAMARVIGEGLDVTRVDLWSHAHDRDAVVHEASWHRAGAGKDDTAPVGAVVDLEQRRDLRRLIDAAETAERHVDDVDLTVKARKAMERHGYRSTLFTPLMLGELVVGLVNLVETRSVRRFTEDELAGLARLSRLAALGIRGAEASRRDDELQRRQFTLLQSTRAIAASSDPLETLESTRDELATLLAGMECQVTVVLRREDGSYAVVRDAGGDESEADEASGSGLPDPLARRAMARRRPAQMRIGGRPTRFVVPLVAKGTSSGYIDVQGERLRRLTDDEFEYVQILANHVALALENQRLTEFTGRQAATDVITGFYNRWYFFERLYSEFARAQRYKQPLSVIVAEIDGFETFTADRGQPAADVVLKGVARLVNASLRRRVDVACRTGPSEVSLLLPNTPCYKPGAALVAERLRGNIEKTEFRDDEHDVLGRFTLSLGISGFPDHAEEPDDLAEAALKALAEARRGGKNRLKVYGTRY